MLKQRAEQQTGQAAERAVVTVPAHFDASQRLATMSAAMLAGFERVSLLQEPIAAAMAYGLGRGAADEQPAILVFDLGGGTFDVSLLQSFDGILEVVASDGDNALGGLDLDLLIADALIARSNLPPGALHVIVHCAASHHDASIALAHVTLCYMLHASVVHLRRIAAPGWTCSLVQMPSRRCGRVRTASRRCSERRKGASRPSLCPPATL